MTGRTKPSRQRERALASLRGAIDSCAARSLPSLFELARTAGVSYDTMRKAARTLADEGAIHLCPGKKIVPRSAAAETGRRLECLLFNKIRDRIVQGDYPVGVVLPKVNYFVITERVSTNTVASVFRRLAGEHLVHKKGNRWLAGPPSQRPSDPAIAAPSPTAPVILIIVTNSVAWNSFHQSFTAAFSVTFSDEISRFGYQAMLVLTEKRVPGLQGVTSGPDEASALIRKLDARYSGAFIIGRPEWDPNLKEWIERLCTWQKPVVFFDHTNEGDYFNRAALATGPFFFRLHTDDRQACALAIAALARRGHREAGIPEYLPNPSFGWVKRRIGILEQSARDHAMRIVSAPQEEEFWEFYTPHFLDDFIRNAQNLMRLESAQAPGGGHDESLRQWLIRRTPSMRALIRNPATTAIIAPNDIMAREYYFWIRSVGLSIPEDVSLVSFDNTPQTQVLPITTVDFGFRNLGYMAAHIFIGDIPIGADRSGNIPGRCALIDRGSIGRPRQRPTGEVAS